MTVFWLVAALFVLGALLMILPPLWRSRTGAGVGSRAANLAVQRDQWREAERDLADDLITIEGLAQARAEIERRVHDDVVVAEAAAPPPARAASPWPSVIALALLVPLGSVLTYLALGRPEAAAPMLARSEPAAADSRHSVTPEQIQKMVTALSERLKSTPNDAEGWLMLGRSYTALGRYRDAAIALRRADELAPGNATLLADLADIVGMVQGKRLAGEPARLVQKALDIDPRHVKALALAGSVSFEARDYAAARSYWERLLAVLPPDSPMLRSVRGSLAQASSLERGETGATAAGAAGPAVAAATTAANAGIADSAVSGRVEISPALAAELGAGDTLFVFARAVDGPRIPLAILRRGASLPAEFKLDDSMAMSPQTRLSTAARVVIGARVSRSGNATPQPGDLVGQSEPVALGTQGVRLTIDSVQR